MDNLSLPLEVLQRISLYCPIEFASINKQCNTIVSSLLVYIWNSTENKITKKPELGDLAKALRNIKILEVDEEDSNRIRIFKYILNFFNFLHEELEIKKFDFLNLYPKMLEASAHHPSQLKILAEYQEHQQKSLYRILFDPGEISGKLKTFGLKNVITARYSETLFKKTKKWISIEKNQKILQKNIKELNLLYSPIIHLPSYFSMNTLCPEISYFKSLTSINLANNNLCVLPPSLFNLVKLQEIDIGHNKLRNIPSEFIKLNKMKKICLSSNFLKKVPLCICEMKELVSLDLINNKIEKLPKKILNLNEDSIILKLYRNPIKKVKKKDRPLNSPTFQGYPVEK